MLRLKYISHALLHISCFSLIFQPYVWAQNVENASISREEYRQLNQLSDLNPKARQQRLQAMLRKQVNHFTEVSDHDLSEYRVYFTPEKERSIDPSTLLDTKQLAKSYRQYMRNKGVDKVSTLQVYLVPPKNDQVSLQTGHSFKLKMGQGEQVSMTFSVLDEAHRNEDHSPTLIDTFQIGFDVSEQPTREKINTLRVQFKKQLEQVRHKIEFYIKRNGYAFHEKQQKGVFQTIYDFFVPNVKADSKSNEEQNLFVQHMVFAVMVGTLVGLGLTLALRINFLLIIPLMVIAIGGTFFYVNALYNEEAREDTK